MKKIYRHFSIFILFIAIILVVSGCGRKSPLPPLQKGEQAAEQPAIEKSLEAGEAKTGTSSSEVAEVATSTEEIDTSDWKTYRNEEYGYSIKYPKDWTVFDNNPYIPVHSSVQFNYNISKDEDAIFRINIPELGHGAEAYEIITTGEIDLSGIKATKITRRIKDEFKDSKNQNIIYISFYDKKFNYESGIEFIYSDINKEYYLSVYDKMIQTLQFTN